MHCISDIAVAGALPPVVSGVLAFDYGGSQVLPLAVCSLNGDIGMAARKKGKPPSYLLSAPEFDALVEKLEASPGKGVDSLSLTRARAVMVEGRQAVDVAQEHGIKPRVITDLARLLMTFHLRPAGAVPAPTVRPTYRLTPLEFIDIENKLTLLKGRRKPEPESMARAREVMVDGRTAADVAADAGIRPQAVTALVRKLWDIHQTPFADLQANQA